MIKTLPVLLLLASSVFAQTNVKPFRLICSQSGFVTNRLVVSGGAILNHQTYTVTSPANTASSGFGYYLDVQQTNQLVETSLDDIDGFLAGINNANLFEPTTGYYGSGPYRVVKGLMQTPAPDGGEQSWEHTYTTHNPQPPYDSADWLTRGDFGVPMFYFMRPTIPWAELATLEIQSSGGALTQIQYYEADPEILNPFTNTVTQSGATADSISGFIAATANWANYSYEQTYVNDYDFVTNGIDPITHESWSYSTGSHSIWEDIILPSGWDTPVDSAIWHFTATKEYY